MAKLSDADVGRLRHLAADGWSPAALAVEFGVSVQHVRRLVRGAQRTQLGGLDARTARKSAAAAVERLVDGLTLDSFTSVHAETALVLAVKLDECRSSSTAAAATAAPGLARQLVEVVGYLTERTRKPDVLDDLRARRQARLLAMGLNGGGSL
jgi:hypothetical protein